MTARIALFRAVNVGGGNRVAMSELRGLFDAMALGPASTLQAAGSVIFHGSGEDADLETRLEGEAATRLGLKSAVFVRSAEAWAEIIAANPFAEAAREAPSRLMVTPLKEPADPMGAVALEAAGRAGEQVRVAGRCAYLYFPQGAGTSKLTPLLIEKKLGTPGTARNWNTTLKLMELVRAS